MTMRVLIVDDEQLALNRLSHKLRQIGDVDVVGAIDDPVQAVAAIDQLRPDLVLLDIEMPKLDGFDVVEAIARQDDSKDSRQPLIGFVTAYPHFALDAFDTGAVDFICKPVRLARLEKMLERARTALSAQDAAKRLQELRLNLGDLREATAHVEQKHFWVRIRGDLLRIRTNDVLWIEAQSCYVQLHLSDRKFLVRNSIGALSDELADDGFVRIHKSALVNRRKVMRIKGGSGQTAVVLEGGAEVRVGRKYRQALSTITEAVGGETG